MPSPVEATLANLLPTINFLPPELISLSKSLLAQSRAKAASLRPDEEIGRTFACCHIACERLSHKLDLELTKPRPPVKPTVYAKLKAYLDTALKKADSAPVTPKTPRTRVGDVPRTAASRDAGSSRQRDTPSTRSRGQAHGSALNAPSQSQRPAPSWSASFVNSLCKKYDSSEVLSHVLTGVNSVYSVTKANESTVNGGDQPALKRQRTAAQKTHIDLGIDQMLPVLATVLFWSVKHLNDSREEFVRCFNAEHQSLELFIIEYYDANEQIFLEGPNAKQIEDSLKHWLDEAVSVWPSTDWYLSVSNSSNPPMGEQTEQATPSREEEESQPSTRLAKTPLRRQEKHIYSGTIDASRTRAGLLPGLGTMFQPAVDWLSDDRCEVYTLWKEKVLREIRAA